VLRLIKQHLKPGQRIFVGVIDPIDPTVETPEEVRTRARSSGVHPARPAWNDGRLRVRALSDDTSTDRDTAFARSEPASPNCPGSPRVEGVMMPCHSG